MGLCFSKKRQEKPPPPPPPLAAEACTRAKNASKIPAVVADEKAKKMPQRQHKSAAAEAPEAAADRKALLVVKSKAAAESGGEKTEEARPVVVSTVPVRTSSCTKEEVDAILIQCGRLSRSSSGKAASSETGTGHRRRGSKRSYDFDQERGAGGGGVDEEGDWERNGVPMSRPSPHRSSPQRKRSGSRDRTSGGSRRSSRSPGRRADGASSGATASSNGARQQPGKMVSVPAREKGRAPSPAAASGKRCASPRSNSPVRVAAGNENAGVGQKTAGPTPSLSRSSSRKAEQSPYRRSPMVELDENSLRNSNICNDTKPQKKSMEISVATAHQKSTERAKEQTAPSCRSQKEKPEIAADAIVAPSETRAPSSKTTAMRTVSIVAENINPRSGCRSRRASRDFDQNPNLYASQLLEDIQSYHTSAATTLGTPPSFTLPACVSKACSIVEAVADLNSSSSENRAREPDRGSVNASFSGDNLVESSVHRYVSVRDIRGETEPQESAGSNSISGNMWTPSCEQNSVESTDRTWSTSRSSNGDEAVEQGSARHGALNRPRQNKQRLAQPEPSSRSRGTASASAHRGRSNAQRGSGSMASARSGARATVN